MAKKFCLLVLTATAILSVLASGCAIQVSAKEIANRTVEAAPGISSVKMDMHAQLDMASSGGQSPLAISSIQDMTAEIKASPKEMHLLMNSTMNMASVSTNLDAEVYVVGQWAYASTSVTGSSKMWIKTQLTPEYWQSQNQLQAQTEFLRSAVTVTKLGNETIDGVECYVLDIKPDLAAITEYMKTHTSSGTGFDYSNVDFAKVFKTYDVKEWVAKDTYLLKKSEMNIEMGFSEQDMVPSSTGSTNMTMLMKATVNYYGYNEPVTITLPPDAAGAKEITLPG